MFFKTVQQMIEAAESAGKTISEVALAVTAEAMEKTEQEIFEQMRDTFRIMEESIENGKDENLRSTSGLTGGMAYKVANSKSAISGDFMTEVISGALAVAELNASMGKIVAAPTAGSCGILPACLVTLKKHREIPQDKMIMGLITSAAVGMIIADRASVSGAQGGCQAECGSAAAMAAAAIVEIMGGTPAQCGDAAAQALKSVMGLVCDPVAGLVEEPCIVRNAACASVAITAAEITLAGVTSLIPVDEVIDTMDAVGKLMPSCLRETAEGGVAITPTGLMIARKLSGGK